LALDLRNFLDNPNGQEILIDVEWPPQYHTVAAKNIVYRQLGMMDGNFPHRLLIAKALLMFCRRKVASFLPYTLADLRQAGCIIDIPDIRDLQQRVAVLEHSVALIREDLNQTRVDVNAIREDLNQTRVDVNAIREDLNQTRVDVNAMRDTLNLIANHLQVPRIEHP
jgi:septal ring factor EnvC (AmiA/AmiB activator)